jgi:hypothetical protein
MKPIQCGWNRKQEQKIEVLYRPGGVVQNQQDVYEVLPHGSQGAQGHTGILVVHGSTTKD